MLFWTISVPELQLGLRVSNTKFNNIISPVQNHLIIRENRMVCLQLTWMVSTKNILYLWWVSAYTRYIAIIQSWIQFLNLMFPISLSGAVSRVLKMSIPSEQWRTTIDLSYSAAYSVTHTGPCKPTSGQNANHH